VRSDVEQCLGGKSSSHSASYLKKELEAVSQHAPEQARLLAVHYNSHMAFQSKMI
jgi:hypothetical protein